MNQIKKTSLSSLPSESLQPFIDRAKSKLAEVLPQHLTPEKMIRLAFREINKNPKLKECSPESFVASILECAELGLEPGSAMGYVYLIPYFNKNSGLTECQVQTSYLGEMELVKRSGKVSHLTAHLFHENDHFDYSLGTNPKIEHTPSLTSRGKILGAYAIARYTDDHLEIEVMGLDEIEHAKKSSKGGNIWQEHFGEMAKKTVIRRLTKRLPKSVEIKKPTKEVTYEKIQS